MDCVSSIVIENVLSIRQILTQQSMRSKPGPQFLRIQNKTVAALQAESLSETTNTVK